MKDGAIQQVAKSEALLPNPATDYVAEFTRPVSRATVITAASLTASIAAEKFTASIAYDAVIGSVADQIEASDLSHHVVQGDIVIGQITRSSVIDGLVGRR
ncbi:MAG: hypothetical protein V3U65_13185 [Granulosicoccaceae bacterium]